MAKVLVNEACKDTVVSTLRSLSDDLQTYKEAALALKPLATAGFDNGELQKLVDSIVDMDEYVFSLSNELGAMLEAYAGLDNAFAKRLQDDRDNYMNS